MAIKTMTREEFDIEENGAIYSLSLSLTEGVSDTYLLPVGRIYALAASQTNGALYFTIDSKAKIIAETAVFEAWDGTTEINLAVRAFYFDWASDTATASVSIRTEIGA